MICFSSSQSLFLLSLLFYILIIGCSHTNEIAEGNNTNAQATSTLDSLFQYHFHILDSIADLDLKNPTILASDAISFMEINTQINGEADGTFLGKFYFTPSDLAKWQHWYELHKDSIRNIRDNP